MRNKFVGRGLAALWRTRLNCLVLYKIKLWKHPIVSVSLKRKINCSTMVIHSQIQLLRKLWWSRLSKTGAPVITVDLLQLRGFFKLPSCQLLPLILFLPRIWNDFFTPRIPTWSPGVGGALCYNRFKSDLSCFLPEQKFHRPSRGITSAPGLNLDPKARYFCLVSNFFGPQIV